MRQQLINSARRRRHAILQKNTEDFYATDSSQEWHSAFLKALLGESRRHFRRKMIKPAEAKLASTDIVGRFIVDQRQAYFDFKLCHLAKRVESLLQEDDNYVQAMLEVAKCRIFHVFPHKLTASTSDAEQVQVGNATSDLTRQAEVDEKCI